MAITEVRVDDSLRGDGGSENGRGRSGPVGTLRSPRVRSGVQVGNGAEGPPGNRGEAC